MGTATQATVEDAMTSSVLKVGEDASLSKVTQLMGSFKVRHLVVSDWDGKPIGIISERDLYRFMAQRFAAGEAITGGTSISKIMKRDPVTVRCKHSIDYAAQIMNDLKIGCVIITTPEDRIAGILTRGDVLRFYSRLHRAALI